MECEDVRDALSARLDGEELGAEPGAVDAHLAVCTRCAAWGANAGALHRVVRVREVEVMPDLSGAIVDAFVAAAGPRSGRSAAVAPVGTARWALFSVALTQLVVALPSLLVGVSSGTAMHVTRELGSFDVALAVGLLVATLQPARAWGLLPVAAALALVMMGTTVVDLLEGRTSTLGEAHHLLDLAGVALLWLVAREPQTQGASRAETVSI